MQSTTTSQADLKKAYEMCQNYSGNNDKKIADHLFGDSWDTYSKDKFGAVIPREHIDTVLKVTERLNFDEFVQFTKTGQLPPLKLSQQEMELLQGGGDIFNLDITWGEIALAIVISVCCL